jgi:hypothetical protein
MAFFDCGRCETAAIWHRARRQMESGTSSIAHHATRMPGVMIGNRVGRVRSGRTWCGPHPAGRPRRAWQAESGSFRPAPPF